MRAKIEKLTPAQEALLPVFREEWRQKGLRTDPIDRVAAERAVRALYVAGGQPEPETVLFFDSPAACLLARGILQQAAGKKLRLWAQLWDQLRAQLWAQLWDQLGAQLGDQLWDQLRAQLGAQLGDQLGAQLGAQLGESSYFIGGQDSFWLAFYKFGQKIGVAYKNTPHMDAYIEYAESCGWMYAYSQVALVSDRPEFMAFDDRNLLHCEFGMSVRFRDGWGIHSWHGQRIPSEWIEKKDFLTPQIALTHANVEQRRAACEILGWAKILRELKAKTIDKHVSPFVGELLEVEIPEIGKEKFLRVKCGTEREFALPVPPDMKRASQAQAWLNFTTEEMFLPQVRT